MRVVLQRVRSARVKVEDRTIGQILRGLLIFVGIGHSDTVEDGQWLADKIVSLRIFPDEAGQMNRSVREIGGEILVVSQFTLYASTRKGTRPSFNQAAKPEIARPLYEVFLGQLQSSLGQFVAVGEFGADMQIESINDGPVTILIDSPRNSNEPSRLD